MPSYRGLDQSAVLHALQNGLALLEKHPIGAEGKRQVTEGKAALSAIAAATSDLELVGAIRDCHAVYFFNRLYPVMEYHAVNNTDGVGLQVFEDLSRCGAFGGAMSQEYNQLDHEQECWLMCRYVRKIEDSHDISSLKGWFTLAALGICDQTRAVRGKTLTDEEIAECFDVMQFPERDTVMRTACQMAGMVPENLPDKNPIQRYGIAIPGMEYPLDSVTRALRQEIDNILAPFWTLDEVRMSGLGAINPDHPADNVLGITFNSTRRAAEAVATAFPQHVVVDSQGQKVKPASKRTTPKPPAP